MRGTASPSARMLTLAAAVTAFTLAAPRVSLDAQRGTTQAAAVKALAWRSIGPANVGGRVSVIVGVPGDAKTYYVAGANGGVFRTVNAGTTFEPVFDHQDVLSIGDVAVAPSDPSVLYVGTGEGNPRNNASLGDGVYRSNDAGGHWMHIGLTDTEKIARIRVHPTDPDTAWVCALGHEWGPNEERGVFKTTDGGRSWKKVLYLDADTGCSDLDINWKNPRILFAGMYTYRRQPWHLESGAGRTAVYRSIDGGETWQKLTEGLPTEPMDRIGIAIAQSRPDTVYVISETKTQGELWRSDNGGDSFYMVNDDRNLDFRPFYYSDVRVDPNNPEVVYTLSGRLSKSTDGGRTFERIGNDVHGDHQALWIDPADSDRVLSGCDGGWQVSMDGGETFAIVNNVAFTQFYHINYDMQTPYTVCGGLQDNGTWCGPIRTSSPIGIQKSDWYTISGGDGFFGVPLLQEPYWIFSNAQGGYITIRDLRSGRSWNIQPYPNRVGSVGDKMADHKYRFNWNAPIVRDPHDPKAVYFGGNVVFKTTNYGQSWTVISPDLTTNDKSKQQDSGGEIVVDNTAAEFHCTILTIAPSPLDANVIWVGTDDGNVQITRDGGKTWTNVVKNIPGLAPNAWIPTIDASSFDAGTAYVAADHHRDGNNQPYAFKTTDYGQSWTPVYATLPKNGWIHVVREDPKNRSLLYAGTELGVYASWDGGQHWQSIRNNIPPAPVRDIVVHPRDNDLIIATHGRGAFVIDDVTPLQRLTAAEAASGPTLFDVRPAIRWVTWNKDASRGQQTYAAENPPDGAILDYYLKADAKNVAITIVDQAGKTVRQLTDVPKTAGVNRVEWDLRFDAPRDAGPNPFAAAAPQSRGRPGQTVRRGGGGFRFGGGAPYVLPGNYTVRLAVDGQEVSQPVTVRMDPRADVPMTDLAAQLDQTLALQDLQGKVTAMIARTDSLMRQLTGLQQRLRGPRQSPDQADLAGIVKTALEKLKTLRDTKMTRPAPVMNYRQYPRLSEEVRSVLRIVNGDPFPPTAGAKLRYTELVSEQAAIEGELDAIVASEIAKINQAMAGTPYISAGGPIR